MTRERNDQWQDDIRGMRETSNQVRQLKALESQYQRELEALPHPVSAHALSELKARYRKRGLPKY